MEPTKKITYSIKPRKKGEELLTELRGTWDDPLNYKRWASNDERAKRYLVDNNILVHSDADDIYDFFNSYVNSEGYLRIMNNLWEEYEKQHPILSNFVTKSAYTSEPSWYDSGKGLRYYIDKDIQHNREVGFPTVYLLDGFPEMSFHASPGTFVYKRPDGRLNQRFPDYFTLAHEFAHRFPQWYRFNSNALKQNTNTNEGHDSLTIEKHSDIWGLKYLLYKEGIYDSRQNKDATPAHIEMLRKKYPKLRPLKLMDNKKTAWMLNHVTQLNKPLTDNSI